MLEKIQAKEKEKQGKKNKKAQKIVRKMKHKKIEEFESDTDAEDDEIVEEIEEEESRWSGPNTGCFSHRWLPLGGRKLVHKKFFPRYVLFCKDSCTLLHCFYILSNLKSC